LELFGSANDALQFIHSQVKVSHQSLALKPQYFITISTSPSPALHCLL
jgi:hypothetical protein